MSGVTLITGAIRVTVHLERELEWRANKKKKEKKDSHTMQHGGMNALSVFSPCFSRMIDSKMVAIYDTVTNEATRFARCNEDAKLRGQTLSLSAGYLVVA